MQRMLVPNIGYGRIIADDRSQQPILGVYTGWDLIFAQIRRCQLNSSLQTKDDLNDTTINMETIGPFMLYVLVVTCAASEMPTTYCELRLSAYLFEETKNTFYQLTGQLSLDFILNNMWQDTAVWDAFDPVNCTRYNYGRVPRTSSQGWLIEGESPHRHVRSN